MGNKKYFFVILILGSLTALAPFSIDMYLPGFTAIAKDLHSPTSKVSLTLTGFFIGICLGQLLYGPLLDRFGRKPPLYIGLVVYILASIACAFAHNINNLIVLRCIQAVGSCAATVTAVALVRDLFPVEESAKVFALLILVLGASPLIAPTVGGYITSAFGWHYIFIILTVMAILLLAACILWLPDVYVPNKSLSLKPLPIVKSFMEVFVEPQFYTYAFTSAIAFAGLFAYVSGSPLIFMNVFGLSAKVYGWVFAFLSIGFIGSSQLNNLLVRKFSSEQIVRIALIGYVIVGIAFFLVSKVGLINLPLTIVFLFLFLSAIGIASPNASSLCLAPFSKNAGTAASLMGAIQMGIGALVSAFVSLFNIPSTTPVAGAIAGSAVLALIILLVGKRTIAHNVEVQKEVIGELH
jgi:DHA1 family bicyclomycin/chloramphenicol resistance-like MFS transporter